MFQELSEMQLILQIKHVYFVQRLFPTVLYAQTIKFALYAVDFDIFLNRNRNV